MIHLQLYSPPVCPRDQNPKSIGRFEPSPWSPLVGAPFQGFAFLGTPKIRHISPFWIPLVVDCPIVHWDIIPKEIFSKSQIFRGINRLTIHDLHGNWVGLDLNFKLYQNHPQWEVYMPLYTQFYNVRPPR